MNNELIANWETLSHTELRVKESSKEVWKRMLETAIGEMKANMPESGHTTRIEIVDGPRYGDDLPTRIIHQWKECALNALGKETSELSETEKFAIAFCCGCEIEFKSDRNLHPLDPEQPKDGPRLRWKTKNKVAIIKDGIGFRCYERRDDGEIDDSPATPRVTPAGAEKLMTHELQESEKDNADLLRRLGGVVGRHAKQCANAAHPTISSSV